MRYTKYLLTSVLALFLVLSVVSAFSLSTTSDIVSQSRNATIVATVGTGETVTPTQTTMTNSQGLSVKISPASLSSSGTFNVSASSIPSGLEMGTYPFTFNFTGNNVSTSQTATVNFVKSFCSSGSVGSNLTITKVKIRNSGDDDDIWMPLDEIEVEVKVENNGDNDIRDVNVELGLFDSDGENHVNDLDFSNSDEEVYDLGRINDGDSQTATFTFKVPADFDFDLSDLTLEIKAYSDDLGENHMCTDSTDESDASQSIKLETQDDEGKFIAFDNIRLSSDEAVCGDVMTLSTDVANVGDEDEDQVKVNLVSKDLKIDMSQEIKSGLDQGDNKRLTFSFPIPAGLRDGSYDIELSAEYDYNNGNYREESEDPTVTTLKVFGCSQTGSSSDNVATISASLDSEPVAGKTTTITTRITNPTNTDRDYVLSLRGYDDWATIDSVSSRSFSLGAGESKTVTIEITPNSDASGEQSFILQVLSGNESESKEISMNLAESESAGLGSGLLWLIIGVNVLLVIVIIVVAVRVSRR